MKLQAQTASNDPLEDMFRLKVAAWAALLGRSRAIGGDSGLLVTQLHDPLDERMNEWRCISTDSLLTERVTVQARKTLQELR